MTEEMDGELNEVRKKQNKKKNLTDTLSGTLKKTCLDSSSFEKKMFRNI